MTPAQLPLEKLSDRELLLLACQTLNALCDRQDTHDKVLFGNGMPGLKSQVLFLWLLAGGLWAVVLAVLSSGELLAMVGKK
jgi:hypothetical protein